MASSGAMKVDVTLGRWPPQEAAAALERRYGDVADRVTVPMPAGMPVDRVRDLLASLR